MQRDQMESESGLTRAIIDELHSSDIEQDHWKVKVVLLEVSLINFILRISKQIKYKVKVVLLEVSLMNFILWISNKIKWKVKVLSLEVSLINFIFGIS